MVRLARLIPAATADPAALQGATTGSADYSFRSRKKIPADPEKSEPGATYYRQSPEEDPSGPREKAKGHVVRGGTFLNGPVVVRATSRIECPDVYRNYVIGFRVVLETAVK